MAEGYEASRAALLALFNEAILDRATLEIEEGNAAVEIATTLVLAVPETGTCDFSTYLPLTESFKTTNPAVVTAFESMGTSRWPSASMTALQNIDAYLAMVDKAEP